jgi:hypothetical protein
MVMARRSFIVLTVASRFRSDRQNGIYLFSRILSVFVSIGQNEEIFAASRRPGAYRRIPDAARERIEPLLLQHGAQSDRGLRR